MITPLRDNVYITPIGDPDVSEGGIIIPDVAKRRSRQGIIKYAGPKCEVLRMGDYVLFSPYNGTVVDLGGEGRMIIMPEDKVELVIDNVGGLIIGGLFVSYIDPSSGDSFYGEAPYETVIELVARSFQDSKLYNTMYKKKYEEIPHPSGAEYDRPRE